MVPQATATSHKILLLNTLAFTVCFAVWMLNSVLVTFLADHKIFNWTTIEVGWLLGIPVLSGSVFRLPIGMLTDRYGGKWVFGILLLFLSIPLFLLSYAQDFRTFALLSFLFGLSGTSFAVGIAYTSLWYPQKFQGTVLGIFGIGNAGAALTTLAAPAMLVYFSSQSENGWKDLPRYYAALSLITGIIFLFLAENKKPVNKKTDFLHMLSSLKNQRAWRYGLYYFLVFGCFVAFSQWLVYYFLHVYSLSLVMAGLLASAFSFPSGIIRAFGGWLSDKFGARKVMYWVLGSSMVICFFLSIPKMEFYSPGQGITAAKPGIVTIVNDTLIKVDEITYLLEEKKLSTYQKHLEFRIFPEKESWQSPQVKVGDTVNRKQILAKGTTRIVFQANLWIFLTLVMLLGVSWGIGKAAVYKYIPDFFPDDIGTVGGMVGVIGGLGGFICPILFGYALAWTGIWTSSWMMIFLLSIICLIWMIKTIQNKN